MLWFNTFYLYYTYSYKVITRLSRKHTHAHSHAPPPHIYIYIYIIIIIIIIVIILMSCLKHGFPWISLDTRLYRPLLPAGLLGYILCPHRATVLAGRPKLARPCEGVQKRTSLMNSFLLHQQCQACLVHRTRVVLEMGGRRPYRCCFLGYSFYDLFNTTRNIFVKLASNLFSIGLVSVHVVHRKYSAYVGLTPTTLSRRLTMHLNDSSSIAFHLKCHSIPKSKFRKILVENTTIIAHKIDKQYKGKSSTPYT